MVARPRSGNTVITAATDPVVGASSMEMTTPRASNAAAGRDFLGSARPNMEMVPKLRPMDAATAPASSTGRRRVGRTRERPPISARSRPAAWNSRA